MSLEMTPDLDVLSLTVNESFEKEISLSNKLEILTEKESGSSLFQKANDCGSKESDNDSNSDQSQDNSKQITNNSSSENLQFVDEYAEDSWIEVKEQKEDLFNEEEIAEIVERQNLEVHCIKKLIRKKLDFPLKAKRSLKYL
ncbi:UNVERIFIED_CONTAM: hypothetical protein RMT77_019756 [Armadillidium vulgare]